MNRMDKAEFIEEIRKELGESPFLLLTDFKGVTVQEMDNVRRAVEKAGARFRVVKNTLCRKALEGTGKATLSAHFKGNIGVVVSGEDPIATAKIEELIDELRANFTIVIVTHSMQQAARVSQRTAFFHLGKVIEEGVTDQIFMNPRHELTRNYITGRFG